MALLLPPASHPLRSAGATRRTTIAPAEGLHATVWPALSSRPLIPRCSSPVPRINVVCRAHPRRVAKVASTIQREISKLLIYDEVLVRAVTPERAGGSVELSAMVSVTDVYVSNDLQVVKVYVSIYSDERGKQKAMNNLLRLEPYVRRVMGQLVPLRLTPEYRFEYDDTLEEADLVERAIGAKDVTRLRDKEDQPAQALWKAAAATRPAKSVRQVPAGGAFGSNDDDGFFAAEDVAVSEQSEASQAAAAAVATRTTGSEKTKTYQIMKTTDTLGKPGPFDAWFGNGPMAGEAMQRGGKK